MASSYSSSSSQTTKKGRSIDEVWNDVIGLTSLTSEKSLTHVSSLDRDHHHHESLGYKPVMILQDYLAGTFKHVVQPQPATAAAPLPSPLSATTLCLSSSVPVDGSWYLLGNFSSSSSGACGNGGGTVICSPTKKRAAAVDDAATVPGADLRHKRKIKNRESAARSRARKQAYTKELEREVRHVQDENKRLRRQLEELRSLKAAQMRPKRGLRRTSTAPI